MPALIDRTGDRYGRLTVIGMVDRATSPRVTWACVCDCGNAAVVSASHLSTGHTQSCGCKGLVRRPAMDRFIENIELADSGCIEWTGGMNGSGYGQFYVGRDANPSTGKGYAHRWSYVTFVEPIPDGLHIDHLCRNPKCVNPDHLEAVTRVENVLRGESQWARNARKSECPSGHPLSGDNLRHTSRGERRCRECDRLRSRAAYWADPEKHRAYARSYKARKAQED